MEQGNYTELKFISAEHRDFYTDMVAKARKDDCYHRAFFYVMGLMDETRQHIGELFDFENDLINPDNIHKGWQTGGSTQVCRMAFNLWCNYIEEGAEAETTPESLFACNYAPYFVEGLKLRFPGRGALMLSEERKKELEDIFFSENDEPEDLTAEEQKYWNELSLRYLKAYDSLLSRNMQEDTAKLMFPPHA